jgi:hypothetical protein
VAGKTAIGELNGETPGASACIASHRVCRWRAKLEIRSLGTFFFLATAVSVGYRETCAERSITRRLMSPTGEDPGRIGTSICGRSGV